MYDLGRVGSCWCIVRWGWPAERGPEQLYTGRDMPGFDGVKSFDMADQRRWPVDSNTIARFGIQMFRAYVIVGDFLLSVRPMRWQDGGAQLIALWETYGWGLRRGIPAEAGDDFGEEARGPEWSPTPDRSWAASIALSSVLLRPIPVDQVVRPPGSTWEASV